MLDVGRLIILREVVRRGTMRAAADALGYTPSAVSQQISRLQSQTHTRLFEREGRTLRPTVAAGLLVEHANSIVAELERAESELAASVESVAGVLAIGAFASGASRLAAPAAVSLQQRYPALEVHVHEMEDPVSIRELELGAIDVALLQAYTHVPTAIPASFHVERLMAEPVLLALPDTWDEPRRLRDLADAPWVAEPVANPAGRALLHACRAVGFEPDIRYRATSFPVIVGIVGQGLGVSFVPALAVQGTTAEGVRFLPVAGARLERTISLAVRPASRRRPAMTAAVATLKQVAIAARPRQLGGEAVP
jgi:DNA-binding transcriptional LysR family regulator